MSEPYIERANRAARSAGADAVHIHADATRHRFDEPFDAVINWFTSFGYADEAHDRALFARAFDALVPGGRVAVDYFNVIPILASLRPPGPTASVKRSLSRALGALTARVGRYPHQEVGSGISTLGVTADFEEGVLTTRWDVGGHLRETRLRIDLPHRIAALLHEAGFESCALRGSVDGRPFEACSDRCIVVARRPRT